jgi:hypothetical protein
MFSARIRCFVSQWVTMQEALSSTRAFEVYTELYIPCTSRDLFEHHLQETISRHTCQSYESPHAMTSQ